VLLIERLRAVKGASASIFSVNDSPFGKVIPVLVLPSVILFRFLIFGDEEMRAFSCVRTSSLSFGAGYAITFTS